MLLSGLAALLLLPGCLAVLLGVPVVLSGTDKTTGTAAGNTGFSEIAVLIATATVPRLLPVMAAALLITATAAAPKGGRGAVVGTCVTSKHPLVAWAAKSL